MEAGSTPGAAGGGDKRWYQSSSFWLGPFMWATSVLVGVVIGIGWYVLGGFPRDHDAYGAVPVPGQATFELPKEEVRLYFENEAVRSGDSTSISDQPQGLDVRITSAGGEEVEVEDVPSWIFSATGDDRGHEPYGKADLPESGEYAIAATDDASGGFKQLPPNAVADDAGPEITVGRSAWNPLDSKFLGAVLAGLAVVLVLALFTLPFRFVGRSSG
jgi:hypothetical protein